MLCLCWLSISDVRLASRISRDSQVPPTTVPADAGGQTADRPNCSAILLGHEGTNQPAAGSADTIRPYRNHYIQPGPNF